MEYKEVRYSETEVNHIIIDAIQLVKELRNGTPWEQTAKSMASKCFNMGMATIPPHKSAQADSDGCGKAEHRT